LGVSPKASQASRHGLERCALPLSESTLRHVIPWMPNQATALIRKPTVVACFSSDKTSA